MSAHEPAPPLVDGDGWHFDLYVYPEKTTRPWRAELVDRTGRRRSFATPLELSRHLARLESLPTGGGLR